MSEKLRPQRVAELIRQEIASLLTKGLKDPRIGFVSVMSVRMSPDLRYANVYVSLYGDESERKSSLIGLRQSAGWVRREVSRHIRLRVSPEIRFFQDDTLDEMYHLEEVFEEIHAEQRKAPMISMSFVEIAEALRTADSCLVTSHVHPDGDAVGSMLGALHLLRAMGKTDITCALEDPVPRIYQNLPGAKTIRHDLDEIGEFDIALVLDVGELSRLGEAESCLDGQARIIVIDHHLGEGPHGASGIIDPSYAATGEMLSELFDAAEIELSREAAHCLYVAQITDTGGYRFSNTNARSHRIAARLVDTGLDVGSISCEVFECMSVPKFELLRQVLDRLEILAGGRLAYSYVTAQDLKEAEGAPEDVEGLVNYVRNLEGVQVGAFFNAISPEVTKVSLRGRPGFDVAAFLRSYGGGGHAGAAGATIDRPLSELQAELIQRLEERLGEEG